MINSMSSSLTKTKSADRSSELISSGGDTSKLSENQLFIEAKRKIYENMYTDANALSAKTILNCNKTIDESQILWISKYAPLIKMSLTKLQIADLSKCSSVEYIYLDEHEMIATDVSAMSSSGTTSASTWQQTTNVTYVKSHGYNGAGVKVGLYDVGVLRYNDLEQAHKNVFVTLNSSGRLIADPYAPTGDPSHAAYCGSIIAATNGSVPGIAPGITLYSTTGGDRVGQFEGAMEWLISQGVRIISMSVGWSSHNAYEYISRWLDHVAIQHDVTTIISAGNDGVNGITGGAMSYNSITVGSNDDMNTVSRTDDVHASFSSYCNDPSKSFPMKPDLVAPGDSIQTPVGNNGGTSLSCPQVAGITALLYQARPSLESNQALTKSILLAGISPCGALMGSSQAGGSYTAMLPKTGAGMVDAKAVKYIADGNRYVGVTMGNNMSTYTKTFTVTSSDTLTRVCFAWLKNNRISGNHTTSVTPSNPDRAVLLLKVTAPNGTVYQSTREGGNVQLISFVPPVTGTYTIQVTKKSAPSSEPNVYFGLSWY